MMLSCDDDRMKASDEGEELGGVSNYLFRKTRVSDCDRVGIATEVATERRQIQRSQRAKATLLIHFTKNGGDSTTYEYSSTS